MKNLTIIFATLMILSGCAGSIGVKDEGSSSAEANAAGESFIDTMGNLSRKLQDEKLCSKNLKADNKDADVGISMGMSDQTGKVNWRFDGRTDRESNCSYNE